MIEPGLLLAFIAASAVLIAIPGPNVALIVANSVAHGTRFGLLTVAGTSTAAAMHLGLTVLGMSALLAVLADWFEWIRWGGVAYLLWIGVAQWRAAPQDLTRARPQGRQVIFGRGVAVGLTNPKTLLFYGAFFPQFVTPGADARMQFAELSLVFLAVAIGLDSLWAVLAGRARFLLARHGRLRNRLSGGMLIGAGVGLAMARR